MNALVGKIVLVLAAFITAPFLLGSGVGIIELSIWCAALVVALAVTIRTHRRKSRHHEAPGEA
ncbi:hypothetical protein [Streptomyces sp. NPDC046887]|uniref:hypothetical protein n=1 Tax=Streptomyces sp. NPDC046887 TaxID=3155472 RepID=UPI00340449B8